MSAVTTLWSTGRLAFSVVMTLRGATTLVALVDIVPRPQEGIRGNKWLWAGASFLQPVGPVAYFVIGRRPDRSAPVAGTVGA